MKAGRNPCSNMKLYCNQECCDIFEIVKWFITANVGDMHRESPQKMLKEAYFSLERYLLVWIRGSYVDLCAWLYFM